MQHPPKVVIENSIAHFMDSVADQHTALMELRRMLARPLAEKLLDSSFHEPMIVRTTVNRYRDPFFSDKQVFKASLHAMSFVEWALQNLRTDENEIRQIIIPAKADYMFLSSHNIFLK